MKYPWEMTKHEFSVAICCFVCFFLVTFNATMVASTLKPFQEEWGVDYSFAMWFKEDIAIAMIVFSLISIALSDKYGKKWSMYVGLILVILSSLMCTFTRYFPMLMLFRMLTGLGISLIAVSSLSILTDVTKKEHLVETIALTVSASCLGAIFAPMIGMLWTNTFGIKTIFLMLIPLCLICLYAFKGIENRIVKPDLKINIPLHATFIAGTFTILTVLFNTKLGHRGLAAAAGVIFIAIFIVLNHRSEEKIFDLRVFKIRSFAIGLLMGVMFNFISHTMDDTISGYLQLADGTVVILGVSITLVALASMASGLKPFIQMVFSPVVAKFSKKHPKVDFTVIGFFCLILPLILMPLILLTPNASKLSATVILAIIGLAVATTLFTPANKKMMMGSVGSEDRNFASSMVMIVSPISKVFGMVILTNMLHGNTTIETYSSSGLALACIFIVVYAIGVLVLMGISVKRKRAGTS